MIYSPASRCGLASSIGKKAEFLRSKFELCKKKRNREFPVTTCTRGIDF